MISPGFRKLSWLSRSWNSDYDPFFWCKFGFGKCFGAASWFSHWTGHHWLSCKIHFSSHITNRSRNHLLLCRIREDDTSKWQFFFCFFFWFSVSPSKNDGPQLPFSPFSLLQMPNDHLMVNVEFLGNLSFHCKRSASVIPCWSWSAPDGQPLIFSTLVSIAKLPEPPLHWTFVSNSWAQCLVDVELSPLL